MNIKGLAINIDAAQSDCSITVLDKALAYCHALGVKYVELSAHGSGVLINGKINDKALSSLRTVLAKYDFSYTVHGPNPLNLMNVLWAEFEAELFVNSLKFTECIGADIMVYHGGRYLAEEDFQRRDAVWPDEHTRAVLWARERDMLRHMGDIAAQANITIAVENARPYLDAPHYSYSEQLAELSRMITAVNHPNVGITLDMGHAYLAANCYGFDLITDVKAAAPYIKHIHLHDNFGKCCSSYEKRQYELIPMGRGDMHMPIGWGQVPAKELLACLPDYDGVITLEMRSRYSESFADALRYTQQLII